MSYHDRPDVQQAVRALESHFTHDEVELLRRDRGFIETLLLASFHRMAADRRRAFLTAKAGEIRAKIEVLRAANELQNLDTILKSDTEMFTANLESARQQAAEARAAREAAERELAHKRDLDEVRDLELRLKKAELERRLAQQGGMPQAERAAPKKSRQERLQDRIAELESERLQEAEKMRAQGLNDDHPYFRQRMNEYEAEINRLRRDL